MLVHRRRYVLAPALAVFAALVSPPAEARPYTVMACEGAADAANHSWVQRATIGMSTATACPTDASFHHAGIQAYAGIRTDVVPAFSNAFSRFDAPAGTSIASATLDYEFWRSDAYWVDLGRREDYDRAVNEFDRMRRRLIPRKRGSPRPAPV